ncbi:DUF1800 domain-containing protein [Stenomitos frigidus]|uniref:DUF1800 domain-containing protein n=1 Tax=Stenomitos frigidus ULC18 TaxID=2107698 RepID=A0A2T1DXD3_9CYAN|nr:DUF1800 domain-containing protein [Stenomitos frigidus]PSB25129.1 DUF1800 domain-containing protein [Stenomitos frigidus ULC18]
MHLKPNVWKLTALLWFGVMPGWSSLYSPATAAMPVDPKILHVLNRLSFGPRPGDVQMVAKMGVDRYIQQQLAPDSIPVPQSLTTQLSQLEALNLTPPALLSQYEPVKAANGQKLTPDERKVLREKARVVMQQAIQARLLRATASPRQLEEVMVDFWYNHFNVFAGKGLDRILVGAYEQQAIRPYAIGRFRALLGATAHHPAMLFYLDNWQNTAPGSPGARGRFTGLNENYARELMELHTLGVEGGYSQQDVITLAKIFTGWGFRRNGPPTDRTTGFYFDPKRHDASDKVFLGYRIKGGGVEEGEKALDILAKSPATARHISYKLAQYFVADTPPKLLVDRLTKQYLSTNGDLRAVLKALFQSPEFWQTQYYNVKFKTPYQYVVSAVRATGIEVTNVQPLTNTLQQLGMPLYGCVTPDGYKNTQDVWLNPDAMTRRISFATTLASGRLPLQAIAPMPLSVTPSLTANASSASPLAEMSSVAPVPALTRTPKAVQPLDATQLAATLGHPFSAKTQQAIATNPSQLSAALMLGSPEFMHK